MTEHIDWDSMLAKVKLDDDAVGEITPILKPCPFCGGEAELVGNGYFFDVSCKNIKCRGCTSCLDSKTEAEAIEAWNRRVNNE